MAEFRYKVLKQEYNAEQLHSEFDAVSFPGFFGIAGDVDGPFLLFDPQPSLSELATAEAMVEAHVPIANYEYFQLRQQAKALLAADNAREATLLRAIVIETLDYANRSHQWVNDFKTAVAEATSLANLKTLVAAIPNLPLATPAQARTAIEGRIDNMEADE